ncbi:MAG: N-acetylmuramoyl-L-alanine amidase [Parcubacteria group bacterium Gr01-1014_72]|nr:MAG: N-acetylmuramoyl-L-alanine amidase [Parcubacteria group bacterium Gr01-1014_72]
MNKLFLSIILLSALVLPTLGLQAVAPFDGKLIALDAGHGGDEIGAVNTTYNLLEKDVNLEVVKVLQAKLEAAGATVVLTREGDETIPTRRERIQIAKAKCEALGKECDVLVSIHHNGSSNPDTDGTLVIYNEKQDKPLAQALLNSLVSKLGTQNLGLENGGFGITVFGHLVSALTEGYFLTNNSEAEQYLFGTRKEDEAQAIFDGLASYFSNPPKKGGRK